MAVCMLNAPIDDRGGCDRRHGRVRIEETSVSLGKVLDLSRSGMRIRTARPIKDTDPPMLVGITVDGEKFQVQCKIAWVQKRGMFKRLVGLEFQGLADETAQRLAFLARSAASNSPMQSSILNRAS
ncbi:MAG: PilZ domain-containing protein [Planctomycetota bacterium]